MITVTNTNQEYLYRKLEDNFSKEQRAKEEEEIAKALEERKRWMLSNNGKMPELKQH